MAKAASPTKAAPEKTGPQGVEDSRASYQVAVASLPQVPPGYKQTEVGVIPEDWEVIRLGDLIDYTKGFAFKSTEYTTDGVRVVKVSDTTYDSILNVSPVYVSMEKVPDYAKWKLITDDLVISTVGSKPPMYDSMVGKVLLIQKQDAGSLLNQNAVLVRDKKRRAYVQKILLNHLRSKRYLVFIESIFRGNANQASITLKELFEFSVPLPASDEEQRAIATALSDVDALIAGLDRLIAKQRDLKQATMQQLLTGQTRLPGFSGAWEVKRLGDVLERIVGGGTPSRSNSKYWGNEIPWVTVKDFATFNPHQTQEAITKEGLKQSASNLIPAGTLITSTRMALGKAVIYEVDVSINQDLKALFPSKNINTMYLYYWFEFHGKAIDDLGNGSTVKGISLIDLKAIKFNLTSFAEQTAIATLLSDMDAKITALEARRDKTRALKQGMMQALLSGRIRLPRDALSLG